jgi:hypothetical protein
MYAINCQLTDREREVLYYGHKREHSVQIAAFRDRLSAGDE